MVRLPTRRKLNPRTLPKGASRTKHSGGSAGAKVRYDKMVLLTVPWLIAFHSYLIRYLEGYEVLQTTGSEFPSFRSSFQFSAVGRFKGHA